MKIAVIGYSGAGKSTLARELGRRYNCPVLHLDRVNFAPGWQERDRQEALAMVRSVLEESSWVIDGNYSNLEHTRRMEEADRILFLDMPRWVCLRQAYRRYRAHRNTTREDMAEGCTEKFDWEFFRWILWDGRAGPRKEQYWRIKQVYPYKLVRLGSRRQVEQYLATQEENR